MKSGIFASSDLIQCYAPPNLLSVMPGNRVMLRSGGPEMTVCDIDEEGRAICQWLVDGTLHSYPFYLECLTCFGAR
ncbi:hypothetical protein BA896_000265 [Janthinobacterium lividum]|uniref:DUF2158 domain-containing protein n=1 Tax=Janthinobacterium lividum TaxID=29581 RepID=A0A1E8PN85_9BURK|nr:hypothetical protein BA896_000265 [Janthinobacterium lividum]